jgi:hypothetical protein
VSVSAFAIVVQVVQIVGPMVIATAISLSVHALLLHRAPVAAIRADDLDPTS